MASNQATVDFALEQMAQAGQVSARKMFGEYALYNCGKLVALVADNLLYVKPTPAGRAHIGTPTEAAPYPGAKPCFLVPADQWEDAAWLAQLIRLTTAELPHPAFKRPPKTAKPKTPKPT